MKKYFILMSAALVALSCAKELADPQEAAGNENIKYKTITFESIATKTTIDGQTGEVAWEEGDEISIYYINAEGKAASAVATTTSAAKTSEIKAQIPEGDNPDAYYAAYPKGSGKLTVTETTDETTQEVTRTVSFEINVAPNKCDGTFKSANYAAAYTPASGDMVLAFKNAVGLVKVALPKDGIISNNGKDYKISGLYLRGIYGGDKNIGNIQVQISDDEITDFGPADGSANINLSKLSNDAIDTGYAYLPTAQCTWSNGLCVRYLSDDGAIPAVFSQDKSILVERGHVLSLPDVSDKVVFDYYVSTDASEAGNGLSADAPMTFANYQSKYLDMAGEYVSGALRMNGTTLHLSEGTYNLASTFKFPAPKQNVFYKVTVEGNGAVLDGGTVSEGTGDTRAEVTTEGIQVISIGAFSHIVLNNLIIQNGYAANGAGIALNYTGDSKDDNSILECNGCQFLRNIASTGRGGALLIATAAAGGVLKFNDCFFKDNQTLATGTDGGTLYVNGGKAAVMFNKCTFHKNKGRKNGVEIYMNNPNARLGLNNCTFNAFNAYTTNKSGEISRKEEIANGATITNKGYTVIANSTVWSSQAPGEWGTIALGSAVASGKPNGSTVVSSVVRNAHTKPAFYIAGNYYQNIKYCIYSGLTEGLNSPEAGKTYFVSNSYDWGIGGTIDGIGSVDKTTAARPYLAYKFTWNENHPCPTLQQIKDAISGTDNIGPMFLAWLETIDGALTTDIAGRARNENAMCPGSYQQADTPVPAN